MSLRVRKNVVAGELLEHKANTGLIIDPGIRKRMETQVMEVRLVGEDVVDVAAGDVVILPPHGGLLLTLYDDETHEEQTLVLIQEDYILALIPEADAH